MRVAVLAVLLAGCASVGPAALDEAPIVQERPQFFDISAQGCKTTTVFFLADVDIAYKSLPAGFHTRDLSAFVYSNTPATSDRVPIFVALSTCDAFGMQRNDGTPFNGSLNLGYVGVYVQPPNIAGSRADEPADHDFYTVAFMAPEGNSTDAVPRAASASLDWTWLPSSVDLVTESHASQGVPGPSVIGAPDRVEAMTSQGSINGADGAIFGFSGSSFFPQAFAEPPLLRFWHDGPHGLGFMEFQLPQRTVAAGPLESCSIAPDSIVARTLGFDGDHSPCGLTDSFALMFDTHVLAGTMRHLEGVHLV